MSRYSSAIEKTGKARTSHRYTEAQCNFITTHELNDKNLKLFNETFGTNITYHAYKGKIKRLQSGRTPANSWYVFTDEENEWFKKMKDVPKAEQLILFERKFGRKIKMSQLSHKRNTLGIIGGDNGRFKKGIVPKNAEKIGTISVRQGKQWIKIQEGCADKNYIQYDRYVWEQANGRKVKRDEVIIHKNRDLMDCRIENLMCIDRSILCAIQAKNDKYTDIPEVTEAYVNLERLNKMIREVENHEHKRRDNITKTSNG